MQNSLSEKVNNIADVELGGIFKMPPNLAMSLDITLVITAECPIESAPPCPPNVPRGEPQSLVNITGNTVKNVTRFEVDNQNKLRFGVKIYPNPTKGLLIIETLNSPNVPKQFNIYDVRGAKLNHLKALKIS